MAGKNDAKLRKGLPLRVHRRTSKFGGKIDKYAEYRLRVGKPRGRGVPGNKSGKNKI